MKKKCLKLIKRVGSTIGYILKPIGIAFAFAFALGRAFERWVYITGGGPYSKYASS